MKTLRLIAGMLMLASLSAAAFAQTVVEKTTIDIPVSSWLTSAGEFVGPLIAAVVLWMIRKLPSQVADILKTMRVEQLLEKAISYGINAVAGATKDKPLSINVGNEVVAKAAQYVVDNGPGWLISWVGGEAGIREKIIARLNVDEKAALQ